MTTLEKVLAAGSDSTVYFGGAYTGGWCVQQVPEEIAEALDVAKTYGVTDYLEIGAASGGTTALVESLLAPQTITIIDDNQHPRAAIRHQILAGGKTPITEIIGDSHTDEVWEKVAELGLMFDFVLIDGDHTTEGILQDVERVKPFLTVGALVMFHDTLLEATKRALAELGEEFTLEAAIGNRLGISVFRYGPTQK